MTTSSIITSYTTLNDNTLKRAYHLMCVTRSMDQLYEEQRQITDKYTHSTSRGHEAVQIAAAMHLKAHDYVAPYYRDEALLLGMGLSPYELMMQLLARQNDPFSGGRNYYGCASLKRNGLPTIPYMGVPDGSHVIPATGMAQGLAYLVAQNLRSDFERPIVFCSLGDGAMTNGEVAEALQIAVLKRLPIVYLIQDNDWSRSARAEEYRGMDAYEFAGGFKGLKRNRINGADFVQAYESIQAAIEYARIERLPVLLHAKCPLIGHYSSDLRREQYRTEDNIALHRKDDPITRLRKYLIIEGETEENINQIDQEASSLVAHAWSQALEASEPDRSTTTFHTFAPEVILEEKGERAPAQANQTNTTQAAAKATDEILAAHPEALYYGPDTGGKLGGLFEESKGLAQKYGGDRVFNMPYQPAYLIGSALGMAAVGCKPIVELTADALWQGLKQLSQGLSKSYYLSDGQFPAQVLIRVLAGAYPSGGAFQSASIESTLLQIPGIKVVYPSNAGDTKGLLKAAFLDPNPVLLLEHRALYRTQSPEVEAFLMVEPAKDYLVPLGKARVAQEADPEKREEGGSLVVITYGMGVYWASAASEQFAGAVEILDLRSLNPLDWEAVVAAVKRHNKALILTEEPLRNSFAEALAGRITKECFKILDSPVFTCGASNVPAIPLNAALAGEILPNAHKVAKVIQELLRY